MAKYNNVKTLNHYIDLFEKELGRNKSANTVINYISDVNQFVTYMEQNDVDMNINNFEKEDFLNFIDHLKHKYTSAATIERKAVSTNEFLSFLNRTGRMKKAPFIDKKELSSYLPAKNKKKVKSLSKAEIKTLVFVSDDLLEECIVRVLFDGGLRVSELVNAKWSDLDNDFGRYILTVLGKGKGGMSKRRTVLISEKTYERLMEMKEGRTWNSEYILESNRTKKPLSTRRINQILDNLASRTGIENLSSHIFRKTRATELIESGLEISFVSEMLGHSDVSVTYRNYVDSERKLHDKLEKFTDGI
ncbi:integrase/recombinase [Bacillus phage Stahl]|uniref:Integrase n=1 Tax=Bacillus phage Stahl TaxID=1610832 RepID=A0A0E3M2X0_9CAUD|nr:integrase [Bacillus phage Stahl]AKA61525.1 integrase/recombinase [Bacillus phage Stahl]